MITVGLLLNLVGVVLLFLVGMPFRIVSTDGAAAISNLTVQVRKIDDLSVLGWIGLATFVLGTLFQVLATLRERW